MNIDWKDVLHYGSAIVLAGAGLLTLMGVHFPGITVDPTAAIAAGGGILAAGLKGPAKAAIILPLLLALSSPAMAADMSVKAPAAPAYAKMCTVTNCTGWFIGGNIANAGGNLDIIGTGLTGLASNGFGLGVQGGYEFWNGQWYAAMLADVDYDASLNAGVAALPASWKDKFTYGVKVRLGYSLASAFGAATTSTATPTLPQQFLSSLMTPYVTVGEEWRHSQPTLVSGAGVEALLATNVTLDAEYLRYTYGQGGTSGTIAGMPTAATGENEFRLSINRHFWEWE